MLGTDQDDEEARRGKPGYPLKPRAPIKWHKHKMLVAALAAACLGIYTDHTAAFMIALFCLFLWAID